MTCERRSVGLSIDLPGGSGGPQLFRASGLWALVGLGLLTTALVPLLASAEGVPLVPVEISSSRVTQSGEALANQRGCFACHGLREKRIGPSYSQIADRYREERDVRERLVKKVIAGGRGVWGPVPMVPHPGVPEEDIRKIVVWILSQE